MEGKLYIIATPIGNLGDITYRAVETLNMCDIIACEDTRHSLTLLNRYNIKKPLVSCHKFNEQESAEMLLQNLREGKSVALISDAGMPGISDPGLKIVQLAAENGIEYTVLPGACALINALVLSGFDAQKFAFAGFLPQKNSEREKYLEKFSSFSGSVIFYSAPHDIEKDIVSIYKVFGERRYAAVREMTKIFETVTYGMLSEGYGGETRGEFVLICEGANEKTPFEGLSIEEHIKHYTDLGLAPMDAVKAVAKDRKVPKSEIYRYNLSAKGQD